MKERSPQAGFSLVEVVIAMGIAVFALVTILSLLPIGLNSNRVSSEELHACDILSAVSADLRNTYPSSSKKSLLWGLQLPYQVSSSRMAFNSVTTGTSTSGTIPSGCTIGLDRYENITSLGASPRAAYQVSVIYTFAPSSTSAAPIQARIIVNWPGLTSAAQISDLTDLTKVTNFVEAYVTFPAP